MAAFSLMPASAKTAVLTTDTAAKSAAGVVYGIVVSAGATGGLWALESGGTEIIAGFAQASSMTFLGPFIPPVKFPADITTDLDGSNIRLTILFD